VKVGDIVLLKEIWQIIGVYYGPGVITFVEQGADESGAWKYFRVQWNNNFSFHEEEHLELISEYR
jgi:hypothetical protein